MHPGADIRGYGSDPQGAENRVPEWRPRPLHLLPTLLNPRNGSSVISVLGAHDGPAEAAHSHLDLPEGTVERLVERVVRQNILIANFSGHFRCDPVDFGK